MIYHSSRAAEWSPVGKITPKVEHVPGKCGAGTHLGAVRPMVDVRFLRAALLT